MNLDDRDGVDAQFGVSPEQAERDHLLSPWHALGMSDFKFGVPRTYINQAGNETTEWADGLKVVRMADGRVKIGRQGAQLRGGAKAVKVQQFASGKNPTAHIIAAFDDADDVK